MKRVESLRFRTSPDPACANVMPMTTEPPTPTPFQRLTEFARRVIAVPKAEVDEQAKKWRRRRKQRKKAATAQTL